MQDVEATVHATCDVHTIPSSPSNNDQLNGSPRRHSSVDEIFGLVNSMNLNGQRQRSLSDSGRKEHNVNGRNRQILLTNFYTDLGTFRS